MLQAITQKGSRINLSDGIPDLQPFFCPHCQSLLILKNGKVKRAHFAHMSLNNCPLSQKNETEEHLSLKASLYMSLKQSNHDVQVEKYFARINQIADVFVNHKLVLEVQCSSLKLERLIERTMSYQKEELTVIWLLGKNLWLKRHLSQLHRQVLSFSQYLGFYLWEIDLSKNEIRLKYFIHEDLFGKCLYLEQNYLISEDLISLFRLPYLKHVLYRLTKPCDEKVILKIQKALIHRSPKWLAIQESAYERGENILTYPKEYFYPPYHPPMLEQSFLLKDKKVLTYYQNFDNYYKKMKNKTVQTLFPPYFYVKI